MRHNLDPIVRRRWTTSGIVVVVLALAWLMHEWWMPLLPIWGQQFHIWASTWGNSIQTISDALAILALVGGILATALGLQKPMEIVARRDNGGESPLRQGTPRTLMREILLDGANIRWVDRKATEVGHLMRNPHLIILGPSRIGKTREALELIQRAVHDTLVGEQRVYAPNHLDARLTGDRLVQSIQQMITPDLPVLLFVDDFTRWYETRAARDRLETIMIALRDCTQFYMVMTGRSPLKPMQRSWLENHRFHMQTLVGLEEPLMTTFVRNTAASLGMNITAEALERLVALSHGVPERTRLVLLRLHGKNKVQVDKADVASEGTGTLNDLWAQTERDLVRENPALVHLFVALSAFHQARVRPQTDMILAYAEHLRRQSNRRIPIMWWPFSAWVRDLAKLAPYEIQVVDDHIQYPDQVVVETTDKGEDLAQFLQRYRRWSLYRWRRHLNETQRWALFDLAEGYQGREHYRPAIDLYTAAIRIAPHSVIYNSRGLKNAALGRWKAAIADYGLAIKLDPQYAKAYYYRGGVHYKLRNWEKAIADYTRALDLLSDRLDKAMAHNERGLGYFALGKLDAAIADFDQAIALSPQDANAYYNRGLAHRESGDRCAAIADFDHAIERSPDESKRERAIQQKELLSCQSNK